MQHTSLTTNTAAKIKSNSTGHANAKMHPAQPAPAKKAWLAKKKKTRRGITEVLSSYHALFQARKKQVMLRTR